MRKKSRAIVVGALLISGFAIACVMKAMPYLGLIEVSAWDIAVAGVQGYSNPARAAALKNLDEAAIDLLGEDEWKNNNYIGPVTYRVANSANIVTEDKPCSKKAAETAPKSGTGTGSGGGYSWGGGRIYGFGGDCLFGCGTVEVGVVDPV